MSAEAFTLDTNILVYSIDHAAGARHAVARTVLQRATRAPCRLTLQSVSEFFAAATRKRLMPRGDAAQVAETLLDLFPTATASSAAVRMALAAAASGRASYWDALLVLTAAEAGCTAILSEDLHDGGTLLGVRVINPFAGDRLSEAAETLLAAA